MSTANGTQRMRGGRAWTMGLLPQRVVVHVIAVTRFYSDLFPVGPTPACEPRSTQIYCDALSRTPMRVPLRSTTSGRPSPLTSPTAMQPSHVVRPMGY